jgi:hypothetical protein
MQTIAHLAVPRALLSGFQRNLISVMDGKSTAAISFWLLQDEYTARLILNLSEVKFGGRSVGIVRSRTKATEFVLYCYFLFVTHLCIIC